MTKPVLVREKEEDRFFRDEFSKDKIKLKKEVKSQMTLRMKQRTVGVVGVQHYDAGDHVHYSDPDMTENINCGTDVKEEDLGDARDTGEEAVGVEGCAAAHGDPGQKGGGEDCHLLGKWG